MEANLVRKQTPEEKELAKKRLELTGLETELAQRELDLTTLRVELNAFEREYLRVVGSRYAELDAIQAQIAILQAKRNPADPVAQQNASEAEAQAENSAREANANRSQPSKPEFTPTEDIKKLYREIAKRVHPDLATDEADRARRHAVMAEVNRAYSEGAIERLQSIFKEQEHVSESDGLSGVAAELIRFIRQIAQAEERIKQIAAEVMALQQSDLYKLRQRAEKASSAGYNLLNEMAADVDKRIAAKRKVLVELTAGG